MIELYSLTSAMRIIMAMLCFIAMLTEIFITIFIAQRKPANRIRLLYEAALALFFLTSSFIFGLTQDEIASATYYSADYLRYAAALPALFAIYLFIKRPNLRAGIVIPMLLLILPVFDRFTGGFYPAIFIAVNIILFLASLEKLMLARKNLREDLSALSIKQALDSIPDGLLFANAKGRTLLRNNTMTAILDLCRINPFLNVKKIYLEIEAIGTTGYCECIKTDGALLLRILNVGTYLITLTPLKSKGREYFQLFAADITEEDILTKELDEYALLLSGTQKSIIDALNNIEEIERLKELLRLKQSIHDIIGQRLSIVHRFLEDMPEGRLSTEKLKALFASLEDDLSSALSAAPFETFEELQRLFSLIDVSVTLSGKLPENKTVRSILLQIIREASTNAVRHGNAKNVKIETVLHGENLCITILNDGKLPDKNIVEGNGIKGMRENLAKIGGNLSFEQSPQFRLNIVIINQPDNN